MKHLTLLRGLGDVPASAITSLPSGYSDTDLGGYAITKFWQAAQSLNPQLPADWAAFCEILRRAYYPVSAAEAPAGYPKQIYYPNSSPQALGVFFDGLGLALRSVGFDQSLGKIDSAMQSLAANGHGQVPVNQNDFFKSIQDIATQVNFFDAAAFVIQASAAQVVTAAQDVGDTLIDAGAGILDNLNYILLAAGGLLGLIVYMRFAPKRAKAASVSVSANPRGRRRRRRH